MTRDTILKRMTRGCAVAALLALPIGSAAVAQDSGTQTGAQEQTETTAGGQDPQQGGTAAQDQAAQDGGAAEGQASGDQATGDQAPGDPAPGERTTGDQTGQGGVAQPDVLVATVGDREIRSGEVMTVVGMLPEPLRAQQPEMLVPIALDQLILRELILQQAREQNLGEDPEVQELVSRNAQTAQDEAMVQVWLQREFADRVTDEQVQQTYDQFSANTETEAPPLEEVRPQIEHHLRQQAMGEIRAELMQGADVTFYGPDGQPLDEGQIQQIQPGGGTGQGGGARTEQSGPTGQGGGEQSGGQAAGGEAQAAPGDAGPSAPAASGDAAPTGTGDTGGN